MSKVMGKPKGSVPGVRRMEIYRWIFDFTCTNGFQPSIRETMAHFGLSISGVFGHLVVLREKGFLAWSDRPGMSRALRFHICPDGTPFNGFVPKS